MNTQSPTSSNASALIAPRILKDVQSPAVTRRYLPTQWPVVGGRHTELSPSTRWEEPEIAARLQEGQRIQVGVLSAPGLFELARDLQVPVYKISTTRDETSGFTHRLAALNIDAYGSMHKLSGDWVADPGFNAWELSALPQNLGLHASSPVKATPRALSVILPAGLSHKEFDQQLHRELANISLGDWAVSSAGTAHIETLGLAQSRYDRFTGYSMGGTALRYSRARELYIFKPRLQTPRLALVIEQIILNAMGMAINADAA